MTTCRPFRAVLALLLLAAGCTVHEVREEYPTGVDVPASFTMTGEQSPPPDRWWEDLGDDALTELIDLVVRENPGLQQSWARLRQSEAAARQAGALIGPELTGEANASRSRTVVSVGEAGEQEVTQDRFGIFLGAAYEVDLWKRLASQRDAAVLAAEASRQDLEAAAMTLTARTAELWYSLAEQYAQHKLLVEQVKVGETFLDLLEMRFALGQATALDLYQQRQQLAATRSQLPLVEIRRKVLLHQLAVLAGLPPEGLLFRPDSALPPLPPLPSPGLPASLLGRRPDVRSAQLRISAADHAVGAAAADLLPSLRLNARGGFQGTALADTFSDFIYQIAAGFLGPLYDGGRRQEEVIKRKEILEERLQKYRETVLEALREVEDALVQEERQRAYLGDLEIQILLARSTLDQARFRYANGLSDYLPVLTALQSLQRLERSSLTTQQQLVVARIQLYRSLGGSWTRGLPPPEASSRNDQEGEPR